MRKIAIRLTDTYVLHFTLTERQDYKTLKIQSQWSGAKDPSGFQTKYEVMLGNDEWSRFINFLKEDT